MRDRMAYFWWDTATLDAHPYLIPLDSSRTGDREPSTHPKTASAALQACIRIAADHGIEMLALDQTRPDVDLPVARVLAPDLCHSEPRFGVARLYEAPARMGWTPAVLAERDLNPVPLLF